MEYMNQVSTVQMMTSDDNSTFYQSLAWKRLKPKEQQQFIEVYEEKKRMLSTNSSTSALENSMDVSNIVHTEMLTEEASIIVETDYDKESLHYRSRMVTLQEGESNENSEVDVTTRAASLPPSFCFDDSDENIE